MTKTRCTCGHTRNAHSRFGLGKLWCFILGCPCVSMEEAQS
jgi:hypothetical protein